jgi:hypothetical protein
MTTGHPGRGRDEPAAVSAAARRDDLNAPGPLNARVPSKQQ